MWETEDQIFAEVQVTNTGNLAGKEVVQIYFEAPQGLLKKPARQLAAFAKTRLLQPGETQQIRLSFAKADMASYDDLGKIKKSAYILEKGTYKFYIGTSVRDTKESILTMELAENVITKQLTAHLVPTSLKERMLSDGSFEELPQSACNDMNECVFEKMEPGTEEGITPAVRCCARGTLFDNFGRKQFIDVAEGRLSLDDFMAQLSDDDLLHLLGGRRCFQYLRFWKSSGLRRSVHYDSRRSCRTSYQRGMQHEHNSMALRDTSCMHLEPGSCSAGWTGWCRGSEGEQSCCMAYPSSKYPQKSSLRKKL